ncbi:ATP-binding protein [Cryobacterium sp. TMN-39-2]|uniref:histidine kinase n=1 Tax=Cryobacterium zongtaii TaxID=1259217 RepID=A0A2S3ZI71_9MICO|nr:ATP-binding protein [Cryobacterium zongtaii]TFC48987.1 ATP-binding protein [Cryobacterium sp. TMN-39-2]TFC53364.1 ATP-binding protein [Cryobacterium sp. TMB3-1-2]TFC72665.1 ATP-binding protein [Cryobacterium sp. TMB3-15]TFC76171.1 ATP-binding protein [Cryobacterium sp. TMB3-10]TFD40598.1 ATP-binding protein [Cryobacterium sp. TMB3-12]
MRKVAVVFPWQTLSAVLAVLTVAVVILWLLAVAQQRRSRFARSAAERVRIDLELSLAEQHGRLAIIRELQDIAVLSLARLITRAEGARYTAESDPSTAVRAATALVEDGRVALADLRRVLTIAREGEAIATSAPGLQSARSLFGVMRDAGLAVAFTESGDRFPLKPGAELAIYRILQSALANALKHGGPGTEARVSFTWTQDGLQLLIDDDGIRAAAKRESASPSDFAAKTAYTIDDDLKALSESISGAGITQMRERAQLFGGIFNAGTVPGVGFSVSAVFPSLRFHNGVHGVNLTR